MQVKDIMTHAVEVVSAGTTLDEAAERMRALDIGVLPVQDGDEVVGVITDRDMTVRAIARGLDPKTAVVGEVMTPDVVFCFDNQTVEEAATKMAASQIRRLVVLNRAKRLVGIVSLDDVATGADDPKLVGETLERASARPDRMRREYQRILLALDGSRFAERVLPCLEPLAQKFGSTVTLLRALTPVRAPVTPDASAGAVSEGWPAADEDVVTDEMRRDAASYLTDVRRRLQARGLTVESESPEGPASDAILRRARQLGVDLIAITTHGRAGVDRMLLGSVAEDVLRRAPCPVLLVRVQEGR